MKQCKKLSVSFHFVVKHLITWWLIPSDQSFTIVKLTVVTGFLVETFVTMVNLPSRKQTLLCFGQAPSDSVRARVYYVWFCGAALPRRISNLGNTRSTKPYLNPWHPFRRNSKVKTTKLTFLVTVMPRIPEGIIKNTFFHVTLALIPLTLLRSPVKR